MPHAGDRQELLGQACDGPEGLAAEDPQRIVVRVERDHHEVLGHEGLLDVVVGADRGVLLPEPDVHAGVEEQRLDGAGPVGGVGELGHVAAEAPDPVDALGEGRHDEDQGHERQGPAPAVEEGGRSGWPLEGSGTGAEES